MSTINTEAPPNPGYYHVVSNISDKFTAIALWDGHKWSKAGATKLDAANGLPVHTKYKWYRKINLYTKPNEVWKVHPLNGINDWATTKCGVRSGSGKIIYGNPIVGIPIQFSVPVQNKSYLWEIKKGQVIRNDNAKES